MTNAGRYKYFVGDVYHNFKIVSIDRERGGTSVPCVISCVTCQTEKTTALQFVYNAPRCYTCNPLTGLPSAWCKIFSNEGSEWPSSEAFKKEVIDAWKEEDSVCKKITGLNGEKPKPGAWRFLKTTDECGNLLKFNGETHNMAGWAKHFGVTRERVRQLYDKHQDMQVIGEYLSLPIKERYRLGREQAKITRREMRKTKTSKCIGRLEGNWECIAVGDTTRSWRCVTCQVEREMSGYKAPTRCWVCKPKKADQPTSC